MEYHWELHRKSFSIIFSWNVKIFASLACNQRLTEADDTSILMKWNILCLIFCQGCPSQIFLLVFVSYLRFIFYYLKWLTCNTKENLTFPASFPSIMCAYCKNQLYLCWFWDLQSITHKVTSTSVNTSCLLSESRIMGKGLKIQYQKCICHHCFMFSFL